ncbi:uncharacterized protein BBOV_IV006820 [Babesia bovis T2Bo]|uniref:Uncharacterized protein n=1 Tax=Babesia bovis TaxID=5865 RepID=A7AR69_BABBO|nr:uncharacterized protein BBOV_IV006820 [Babesia bovis T2Bo]EDO07038.1 hypothetical protein BBOV_IV006820 [Babesia bovis T2Bo]|eukprot:XP_001610606.1 hypothetical protein [Babesia bovis T2Bo]
MKFSMVIALSIAGAAICNAEHESEVLDQPIEGVMDSVVADAENDILNQDDESTAEPYYVEGESNAAAAGCCSSNSVPGNGTTEEHSLYMVESDSDSSELEPKVLITPNTDVESTECYRNLTGYSNPHEAGTRSAETAEQQTEEAKKPAGFFNQPYVPFAVFAIVVATVWG